MIAWVGPAAQAPAADRRIDLGGRAVIPGFVDSPHPPRLRRRPRGRVRRADDAASATTAAASRVDRRRHPRRDDDELRALLAARVAEMRAQGTTTVEIKSGYGLTVDDEARALRIAREVTAEIDLPRRARRARRGADAATATSTWSPAPMLAACAPHAPLGRRVLRAASPHAFDGDEARAVLDAGRAAGLELRVHGNQLGPGPGVALAVELGRRAASTTAPT